MRRLLFIIVLTAMGMGKGLSQSLIQTYVDRCTGQVNVFAVPMNGQATIVFYNRAKTFTSQQFQNGNLQSWLEETYLWWSTLNPCSIATTGVVTTQQQTQQTTQQATQAATNAAASAAQTTPPPVPSPPVQQAAPPPAQTATTNPTTNATSSNSGPTPTSDTSQAVGSNTSSTGTDNSSSSSTQGTSTDASTGNDSTTPGGSDSSSGSTQSDSTSSDSSSTETTQSTEETSTADTSSDSSSEGGAEETPTEDTSESPTEETSEVEESSTEESTEETSSEESNEETSNEETDESTDEETTEEPSEEETDESTEEDSQEESDEEESESNKDEESEEEDSKEESDNENEKEDGKKKKKKRAMAPPIISANMLTQQSPLGGYDVAATFGVSQSSLMGDKTYGLTAMAYSNGQQFMLTANFSKVHINKEGRINYVYSSSLGGAKMFTTYMGVMNHSVVFLGKKGSAAGLAFGTNLTSLELDVRGGLVYYDQTILGVSLTGFYTKPFTVSPKFILTPMVAISSPFASWSMQYGDDIVINKDLLFIGGPSVSYKLTQRFGLNVGATAITATIKDFPVMLSYMIGGRFSF